VFFDLELPTGLGGQLRPWMCPSTYLTVKSGAWNLELTWFSNSEQSAGMTQTRNIDTLNPLTRTGRSRTVEVAGGVNGMSQRSSAHADPAADDIIVHERVGTSATAGTVTRIHYYGGFTIGATVSTAAKYQTLTDHLGNVRKRHAQRPMKLLASYRARNEIA